MPLVTNLLKCHRCNCKVSLFAAELSRDCLCCICRRLLYRATSLLYAFISWSTSSVFFASGWYFALPRWIVIFHVIVVIIVIVTYHVTGCYTQQNMAKWLVGTWQLHSNSCLLPGNCRELVAVIKRFIVDFCTSFCRPRKVVSNAV